MRVLRKGKPKSVRSVVVVCAGIAVGCVHEAREPPKFQELTSIGGPWRENPDPQRGALHARGPRPLRADEAGPLQDGGGLRPLEFSPIQTNSAEVFGDGDDALGDLQPRFDWNLIRGSDGTLTKVYFFRTDKPGATHYLDLMRRFVPGFAALRDGTDYKVVPNYLRDPRVGADTTWKGGTKLDLASGEKNSLDLFMITADEMMLRQIDAFLQGMLAEMPQVEIEITIVEIAMDDTIDFGVQAGLTRGIPSDPESGLIDEVSVELARSLVQGTFGTFSALHDESVINGFLELLQTTTHSNVLSSPKLAVLNGHRAVIDTGTETPVFTPTFNASGLQSIGTGFEPTGILVVVTPFLLDEQTVQLEISIEVSAVTGFVTAGIGSDAEVENPLIAQRNAHTVVNVPLGQTVMLGGLVTTDQLEEVTKVPLLGDVPLIGRLFRRTSRESSRSQVLFLVRPSIVAAKYRAGAIYDPASEFTR